MTLTPRAYALIFTLLMIVLIFFVPGEGPHLPNDQ